MLAIRSRRKPWLAKLGVRLFGRLALLGERLPSCVYDRGYACYNLFEFNRVWLKTLCWPLDG